MSENTMGTQVAVGMIVYDVEGERIGTIDQHTVPGQYIAVQKGSLFHKDVYISFNAIQRSDINGVYLSMHRNDLDAEQYNTPPGGMSGAGAGGATATEATGAGVAGAVAGASASPIGEALSELADDLKGVLGGHHTDAAATTNRTSANAGTTDATGTGTESGTNTPSIGEALGGLVAGVKDAVSGGQTGAGAGGSAGQPSSPTRAALDAEAIANAFKGQDLDIPVMGEEFAVAKRSVVVEELRLRKVAVHEERQVTDTVRKERISIEGAAQVIGADATGPAAATTGAAMSGAATTGAANTQTTGAGTTVQQTTQAAGANAQGAAHGVANAAEGLIDRVDKFLGNDK